jgi:hypothetical protein
MVAAALVMGYPIAIGRCNHGLEHRDCCNNRPATPKDDGPMPAPAVQVINGDSG